ncbi:MAG: hypothetical protein EU542_05740 [Promethearchaeota archaeon]|nr:MAG: hypothetical protein EU542_05740 [Candidatus Lokiarchaeota archaeon]
MVLIQPEFEIDGKNRVLCKYHSHYFEFITPTLDYFEEIYLDSKLTCLTCDHYQNDECYFTRSKIDDIEKRRKKGKRQFSCVLCGQKIERMFTIVHKLYNEQIDSVKIPLICCDCLEMVENHQYLNESKKLMYLYSYVILTLTFFIFYLIILLNILNLPLLVKAIAFASFGFLEILLIIKSLKRLILYRRGNKILKVYYDQK